MLVRLNGRADDIIFTKGGKQIPGRSLPQRFLASLGVGQYQIIQENYDEVILKMVLDKEKTEETEFDMVRQIKGYYEPILGKDIALKVQLVNQIYPAKSGKTAVFVSKVSPPPVI